MAIRLLKSNAVIYELPKTGTTWIRRVLSALGIRHQYEEPLRNCCERHSPWWCYEPADTYVAVVRHPLPWYESWFRFHTFGSNLFDGRQSVKIEADRWYPHRVLWQTTGEIDQTFDYWMNRILSFYPAIYTRLVDTFVGPLGETRMDVVMRTESLREDLDALLTSLGYTYNNKVVYKYGKQNVSRGSVQWTRMHQQQVMTMEQAVIRRFYE